MADLDWFRDDHDGLEFLGDTDEAWLRTNAGVNVGDYL